MQNHEVYYIFVKALIVLKDAFLGGIGGIIAYMFNYSKQKEQLGAVKWSYPTMLINMCIGAFIAYSLGNFIPFDATGRNGIICLIGVTSYAILGVIESRFAKEIVDRFIGVSK